jgi:hypothetical protein
MARFILRDLLDTDGSDLVLEGVIGAATDVGEFTAGAGESERSADRRDAARAISMMLSTLASNSFII